MRRKIVEIDQEKCDGCGLCVPACAEGAIRIVNGKARLVSEVYCDGLGACLGECPQDAIRIVEREAEPFDEEAARKHAGHPSPEQPRAGNPRSSVPCGCPSLVVTALPLVSGRSAPWVGQDKEGVNQATPSRSGLVNWPVQLRLVPPEAPFLKQADLLLVADCAPFAMADFHGRFLGTRPVVVGCPKLDDAEFYVEKLAAIIAAADIRSLTVVRMEVPCCGGLEWIAQQALEKSGSGAPLESVTVSIRGEVVPRR